MLDGQKHRVTPVCARHNGRGEGSSRIHIAGLLLVRVSHGLWPRYRRPLTRRGAALYRSVRRPSARLWCKRRNEAL